MSTRILTLLLVVLGFAFSFALERTAHADPGRSTFALVVTSNRTTRLSRPDLRYADDDGAKYYEMFRMLAPESNLVLLTTFDGDTQKLFPELVGKARPPSVDNVRSAARALGDRIRTAAAHGPVDFYFVFAGHGDVEKGKGFLELSDGAFTSDDLESMLRSVPATRTHVILDSCNSFFVINSRKPGGRRFVTSAEATRSVSERFPNVGVFLSTSAEAEVFEWSELQSGVFSHAVRSGLSGAADVDGDGNVSYDELRAFVNVASTDIKNANFRPQVFARGPGGRGGDALVDLNEAKGARVRLDGARRRLTLRDQNEVPWLDVHKEAGKDVVLRVPSRVATSAALEETTTAGTVRYALQAAEEAGGEIALASLSTGPAKTAARGPDDMFRTLFARPFGPAAYAQFRTEEPSSEPIVMGVSHEERERLRLALRESASAARSARQVGGALTLPFGLGLGAVGGLLIVNGQKIPEPDNGQRTAAAIMGGLAIGGGLYVSAWSVHDLLVPSYQERTYDSFVQGLALAPDAKRAQALYAESEERLFRAAVSDRRHRTWTRWVGLGVLASSATSLSYFLATSQELTPVGWGIIGVPMVLGGALFFESLFPTTTERMADIWMNDPGLARSRSASTFQVKPVFSPLGAGLTGTF